MRRENPTPASGTPRIPGRFLRPAIFWAALLLFGSAAWGDAANDHVPSAVQVPLLLKILTFDLSLATAPPGNIRITVVAEQGDGDALAVLDQLHRFQNKTVGGRSIDVTAARPHELVEQQAMAGDVLCLSSSSERSLPALLSWAGEHHALTFATDPKWVERGVALAIGVEEGKPKVFVNLGASRAEGRELDARLLSLARVWR